MKRFTLAILLCLASVAAMAQHATTFNQRLFDAKMAEMVYRLKLTDKQVADFRPVYEQYNKDMIAAWGEPCTQSKTKPQTSNEASAQIKKRMERQKRAQEVRIRYTDRFAAILNAEQMQQFFKVENGIQKRLHERKACAGRKGAGHGPRQQGRR